VDGAGGGLVINQIVGGPLRLLARLCALADTGSLPEELSRRLVAEFEEVGVPCEVGGTFGFNANHHARIAPGELDYAGDWGGGEDAYALPELELGAGPEGGLFLASSRTGERIVPLELGMMAPGHQPWLRRLLTCLHQPSLRDLRPSSQAEERLPDEERGHARRYPRVTLGRCVLSRASWRIPPAELPRRAPGEHDFGYFMAVRRWRRRSGLPEEVYVRSKDVAELFRDARDGRPTGARDRVQTDSKPQYVHFGSFFLVDLFEQAVAAAGEAMPIEEAFPGEEEWDGLGCDHVLELVMELGGRGTDA
jgi:hypothetical protein